MNKKQLSQILLKMIHEKGISILDNNTILLSLIRDYYPGNEKELYLQEKLAELISLGKLFDEFNNDIASYRLLCTKLAKEMMDRFSITKEASDSVLALWTNVFEAFNLENEKPNGKEMDGNLKKVIEEKEKSIKDIQTTNMDLNNVIKEKETIIDEIKSKCQKFELLVTKQKNVLTGVSIYFVLVMIILLFNGLSFYAFSVVIFLYFAIMKVINIS